jgi:hypothetical protein
MTDWDAPDKYEGRLVLPTAPAARRRAAAHEDRACSQENRGNARAVLMAPDWDAPDKYEGRLVLPNAPASVSPATAAAESSVFDSVVAAVEALYKREPKLTRNLLDVLRAASTSDLKGLFGS